MQFIAHLIFWYRESPIPELFILIHLLVSSTILLSNVLGRPDAPLFSAFAGPWAFPGIRTTATLRATGQVEAPSWAFGGQVLPTLPPAPPDEHSATSLPQPRRGGNPESPPHLSGAAGSAALSEL